MANRAKERRVGQALSGTNPQRVHGWVGDGRSFANDSAVAKWKAKAARIVDREVLEIAFLEIGFP